MRNGRIAIILLLVIVVVGAAAYFINKQNSNSEPVGADIELDESNVENKNDESESEIERKNEENDIERLLSEEEAKEVAKTLVNGVESVFRELGNQHRWHNSMNPADFNILKPGLLKYATTEYTNGDLKELSEVYYCDCGQIFFPLVNFDVRFKLLENTPSQFVASSLYFNNETGEGGFTAVYTFAKEDGEWKLHNIEWIDPSEQPMNISWEEVQKEYALTYDRKIELLNEVNNQGRKLYIIKEENSDFYWGIYADNSDLLYEIPNEFLPESMQKLTPQEAEQLVLKTLGYENHPEIKANYDRDTEKGYYSIQVYSIQDRGTQFERVATFGWYEVNPETGDIYDSILGGKVE